MAIHDTAARSQQSPGDGGERGVVRVGGRVNQ